VVFPEAPRSALAAEEIRNPNAVERQDGGDGVRLQILDWNKHFENFKSRQVDRCSFVCIPNKQGGLGLTSILSQPDGATVFGIFILIIEACSTQKKPRKGYLTDTGRVDGRYWSIPEMAVRWRRSEADITRAISVLCSPEVGWMIDLDAEDTTRIPRGYRADTAGDSSIPIKEGMEGREGKEGNPLTPLRGKVVGRRSKSTSILPPGFLRFWDAFPACSRRVARTKCAVTWQRHELEAEVDAIVAHLEQCKNSEQWKRGVIPLASTYLNQRRWEAPPPTPLPSHAPDLAIDFDDHHTPEFKNEVLPE
jgi:hypothetical protein